MVFWAAAPFCTPTRKHWRLQLVLSSSICGVVALTLVTVLGREGCLIVVLTSFSIMTKHIEHILMFSLVIHISSLVKGLFKSLPIRCCCCSKLHVFLWLSCKSSLYVLDTYLLLDICFTHIFLYCVACPFILISVFWKSIHFYSFLFI